MNPREAATRISKAAAQYLDGLLTNGEFRSVIRALIVHVPEDKPGTVDSNTGLRISDIDNEEK